MPKYANVMNQKHNPHQRPSKRGHWRLILMLGLMASPLLFEMANFQAARWRSMLGTHAEARTPIWDAIGDAYQSASSEWDYRIGRGVAPGRWTSGMAIPAVIIVAVGSTFFLRSTTR